MKKPNRVRVNIHIPFEIIKEKKPKRENKTL